MQFFQENILPVVSGLFLGCGIVEIIKNNKGIGIILVAIGMRCFLGTYTGKIILQSLRRKVRR